MIFSSKKKLTDQMLGMIAVEISMYMRWREDNGKGMLMGEALNDIILRVLIRENYKYSDKHVQAINFAALASDFDQVDKFRKQTRFDEQVGAFERSIGL